MSSDKTEGEINIDFVKYYEKLEREINPHDYSTVVPKFQQRINDFNENRFTRGHNEYFLTTAIPKISIKLIKESFSPSTELQFLFRSVISIILKYGFCRGIVPLIDTLAALLDPTLHYHFKKFKIPNEYRIVVAPPICQQKDNETLEDFLNFFGHEGFQLLFKHLRNENESPCTLLVMNTLINTISNLRNNHLSHQFMETYLSQLQTCVWSRLSHLTEIDLRSGQKEDFNKAINGIIEKTYLFMDKIMPQGTVKQHIGELALNVARQCLTSHIFEKRIYGLTFTVNLINGFRSSNMMSHSGSGSMSGSGPIISSSSSDMIWYISSRDPLVDERTLTIWLLENKILSFIFGSSRHVEIIKRCAPVVEFLARQDALDEENMRLCLDCIQKAHSSVATKVLEVLTTASASLLPKHVERLINFFESFQADQYDIHVISFFSSMAKAQLREHSHKLKFFYMLWQIVDDVSQKPESSIQALRDLERLVALPEFSHYRGEWTNLLVSKAKNNSPSTSFYYQLLGNIIVSYQRRHQLIQSHPQPMHQVSQEFVAMDIQHSHNWLEFLFEEYGAFKDKAFAKAKEDGILEAHDLDNRMLGGRVIYIEEIRFRINLIELFINLLSEQYLELLNSVEGWEKSYLNLWNMSIINPLTNGERELALKWFTNLREKKYSTDKNLSISNPATIYLFQKMLLLPAIQDLDYSTYRCFQLYFCYANIIEGKMTWISPPNFFQVKQKPLFGIDTIWNIVLDSSNEQVVESSMKFLNQIHENIDPELKRNSGILDLRDDFISTCLSKLEQARILFSKSQADNALMKRRIERCLALFMHQASMNQMGDVASLTKCVKPVTLLIVNTITNDDIYSTAQFKVLEVNGRRADRRDTSPQESWSSLTFGPTEFIINTHTQATLIDIRKLIWDRIFTNSQYVLEEKNLTEEDLLLKVHEDTDQEHSGDIKDLQKTILHQTLSQLNVTSRHIIQISITPCIDGRATILKERMRKSHSIIHHHYNSPLPMDADEKANSIVDMFQVEKELAIYALRRKNWDVNQTAEDLSERLHEIQLEATKAGVFNNTSSSTSNSTSAGSPNDIDKTTPGWILANSKTYFEILFHTLLEIKDAGIQSKIWNLLHKIPPAAHITNELFTHQTTPSWDKLFGDQQDTFRLLYLLQAIDNFLFSRVEFEVPVAWLVYFISTGGLDQLISIFFTLTTNLSTHTISTSHHTVECLVRLLKILTFSISVCMKLDENVSRMTHPQLATLVLPQIASLGGDPLLLWYRSKETGNYLVKALLSILQWISQQPSLPKEADGTISDNDLWLSSLVCYCFTFLTVLSNTPEKSITSDIMSLSSNLGNISGRLLFHTTSCVRDETATGLYHLVIHSPSQLPPILFEILLNQEPSPEDNVQYLVWPICGEYYWLLSHLVDKIKEKDFVKGLKPLIPNLVESIIQRPIFEEGKHTDIDHVLKGKITFLMVLLKLQPDMIEAIPSDLMNGKLVDILVNEFLFTVKVEPYIHKHENSKNLKKVGPKCKSRASRVAAFDLILYLCQSSRVNYARIVTHLNQLHSGKMKPITSWQYHPRSNDKAVCGYVGINNLGATCYMNSLLQQFYQIPTLRYCILEAEPLPEEIEKRKDKSEPLMLTELQYMFSFLQESEMKAYDPTTFCHTYKVDGQSINVLVQQDVDEFMNVMCSELESQLKGTCHSHVLQRHFGVVLANEIRSVEPEYPYFSETPEEFLRIPLEVKNNPSIEHALNVLVACDKLEGDNAYNCEKYQRKLNATKRYCIKSLSNTLIFNLKRFEYDFTSDRKLKVNDYFSFPHHINMKPWTQEGLAGDKSGNDSNSDNQPKERPDSYYEYDLVGVLVHCGSADSGHYYSYIRTRGEDGQFKWFEFNDSRVVLFNVNTLHKECFGGIQEIDTWDNQLQRHIRKTKDIEKSAYMLFYQRTRPEPVNYWGDQREDNENLSTEERAKRVAIRQKALAQATRLEKEREKRLINGVPSHLHQKVWQENTDFLRDRQFFDSSYFEFLLAFAKLFSTVVQIPTSPDDVSLVHGRISFRFVIEILCHAADKSTLLRWIPVLRKIFSYNPWTARNFLVYIVKPKEEKKSPPAENDENLLKDMLLDCPNEHTRVFFCDLVTAAMTYVSPYEYESHLWFKTKTVLDSDEDFENISVCCQIIHSLFSMLDASRSVWRRFKQYFEVIRNFVMIDWYHREYIRTQNIFREFHDYFMNSSRTGKSRAQIMDNEHFPDLHEFYEILEEIICGAKTELQAEMEDSQVIRTPMSLEGPLNPPLSDPELNALYDGQFFYYMMDMDYHSESMSRILCHVSFENPRRSQSVIHSLLYHVRGKKKTLCRLVYPLLFLKDSLQSKRIHWLLNPFESPSISSGILGLLKNEKKHSVYIIHFLMHSMARSRYEAASEENVKMEKEEKEPEINSVYKYLLQKRAELYSMRDNLANKIENSNETLPKSINEEEANAIEEEARLNFPTTKNLISPKKLYILVSVLIDQAATESSLWEKEESDYIRKIEALQSELKKIKSDNKNLKQKIQTIQNYYRQKASGVPPPDLELDDNNWINTHGRGPSVIPTRVVTSMPSSDISSHHPVITSHGILGQLSVDLDNADISRGSKGVLSVPQTIPEQREVPNGNNHIMGMDDREMTVMNRRKSDTDANPRLNNPNNNLQMVVYQNDTSSEQTSSETIKNVQFLRDIFPAIPEDVIKVALSYVAWNTDRAANNLLDEDNIRRYTKEAEEKKNNSNSTPCNLKHGDP